MYLSGISEARLLGEAALDSLQRLALPAVPNNYALWYEYHSGSNPNLQQTIDVILSNNAGFDEKTLEDLYVTFFSSIGQEVAIQEASSRVLEMFQKVAALARRSSSEASSPHGPKCCSQAELGDSIKVLKDSIECLVSESQRVARQSAHAGIQMRESENKRLALERSLESALREATVDGLTGISNRRCFDATLRRLAGEAMNSGEDLALLMIDIDHFKHVNDTWGHQLGDSVLRHVAKILQQAVRGQDCVARYGGEEFAILLPRSDLKSAAIVGENIREALARTPVAIPASPPIKLITVSVGATCYEPGDPLTEWIERTDGALYLAKREGRNCVRSS